MKKQLLFWSMLICIFTMGNAQNIDFPDANFKNALLIRNVQLDLDGNGLLEGEEENTRVPLDANRDGEISILEAQFAYAVSVIDEEISSLEGIEYFENLYQLDAGKNLLTSVDLSNNVNLEVLYLNNNQLTGDLDISNNVKLRLLQLISNNLTHVDVSNNVKLEFLNISRNELTGVFDVSKNVALTSLSLEINYLTAIGLSNNPSLTRLELNSNDLTEINLLTQTSLTHLELNNNDLTEINLLTQTSLTRLEVSGNDLTEINLSNQTSLTELEIETNNFTEIDLSNQAFLARLYMGNGNLTAIDLSGNPLLRELKLNYLGSVYEVNLQNQTVLESFKMYNSSGVRFLDLSSCSLKNAYFAGSSNLETVFMTGQPLEYETVIDEEVLNVSLSRCPNLQFICADQEYLNDIYSLLEAADQTDVQLSNVCDDPHNRIEGDLTYDVEGDGCGNADDVAFNEGIRLVASSLTGGVPIWSYPNEDGHYAVHVSDDTYSFIPVLENNTYFTINPPVVFPPIETVIPDALDTLTTDYCIQPLGVFNDLEIAIYPTSRAIPGFTASYVIIYKNIGTNIQSGTVTLDYENDVLEFGSSTPDITSDIDGKLTWEFDNLLPMQKVKMPLTFVLNTPTDSPALNGGDILNYTVTITGEIDETPENNVAELAQLVVNSYDPNDKTCLEGDILDPDDVGNYLSYLIRFENEGTAEARIIRVTDVIDTTKFDIESFEFVDSSHTCSTTITNESEIEFTFNNINLPFDDENNDGYVLFKIKTLDTLVEGDEIVNGAAIYFDYNLPVITENSVVEVKREVVDEPGFSDYFTLSPNPTTGIMNLEVLDDSIAISYFLLYDMGGNLVGYYLGTTRTMDVSYLFPNTYIMKVVTDKGELSTQFIKL